jgi:hypothetical protein
MKIGELVVYSLNLAKKVFNSTLTTLYNLIVTY